MQFPVFYFLVMEYALSQISQISQIGPNRSDLETSNFNFDFNLDSELDSEVSTVRDGGRRRKIGCWLSESVEIGIDVQMNGKLRTDSGKSTGHQNFLIFKWMFGGGEKHVSSGYSRFPRFSGNYLHSDDFQSITVLRMLSLELQQWPPRNCWGRSTSRRLGGDLGAGSSPNTQIGHCLLSNCVYLIIRIIGENWRVARTGGCLQVMFIIYKN